MDNLGKKILKIMLFIGIFAYLQYYDLNRGAHTINSVTAGLMMASAAYLIASLFGLVLNLFRNYLIAIVGTGALALFLAFKLDEVIAETTWLTEGRAAALLGAFATVALIRDILSVKRALTVPKMATEVVLTATLEYEDANATMLSNIKANPQSVLNLSNMLEEKWGRKPSYEEVMDYIDHLAIPEDNPEDEVD